MFSTSRRVLAAAAAAALLVAACGGSDNGSSGSSAAQGPSGGIKGKRFTLMVQSTPSTSKVVTAHAIELLKQQGVNATLKYNASSTNVAIAQLLSKNIDVYGEAVAGGVGGALQGIPLVDFALMQPRADYVMLAKNGIADLQGLRGKKVGVQDTTGANYAQLLMVLQKAGMSAKDVHVVAAGGQSSRLPALVAGRVDATMLSHGAEIALAGKGFKTIFDYTKEASTLYDDNAFATKEWLSKNGDLAVAFNKALLDSFAWFSDPKNANAVVDEALKIAPAEDRADTAKLFELLRSAGAYPPGTTLDLKVLDAQQQLFKSSGMIDQTLPIAQWADDSYAKKAAGGA
jgi:ABC-type nitrate/sulfonate/bicarbonate transport system substrate-binding protein